MLSKAGAIVVLIVGFLFAVLLQLGIHTESPLRSRCDSHLAHEEVSGALKPASELKVRQ